jgi:hypothetical protein
MCFETYGTVNNQVFGIIIRYSAILKKAVPNVLNVPGRLVAPSIVAGFSFPKGLEINFYKKTLVEQFPGFFIEKNHQAFCYHHFIFLTLGPDGINKFLVID